MPRWGMWEEEPARPPTDEIEHEPEPETRGVPLSAFGLLESSMTAVLVGAPLAPPLRHITSPRGRFGAPRYNNAKNTSSSARPFYAGQKPRATPHQGIDLEAVAGEDVLAVGAGKVVPANAGVGGNVVVLILDGSGHRIVYADLGHVDVKPGDHVELGQRVARVAPPRREGGGSFVHVAIRPAGAPAFVDPKGWIPYAEENA